MTKKGSYCCCLFGPLVLWLSIAVASTGCAQRTVDEQLQAPHPADADAVTGRAPTPIETLRIEPTTMPPTATAPVDPEPVEPKMDKAYEERSLLPRSKPDATPNEDE